MKEAPRPRLLLARAAAIAVAASWLGVGCGRDSQTPTSAASKPATRGEMLRVGIGSSPKTMLAPFATVDDEVEASYLVSPYLMTVDLRGELVHEPGLAERWEVSDDGLTITFFLKAARWTDGAPITANDVVFTYGLVANESFTAPGRQVVERLRQEKPVEAVDARTVRFHFRSRYYLQNQLADANLAVLPAHVYRDMKPNQARGTELARAPKVTHGPFRLVRREPALIELERNDDAVTTRVPLLKRIALVTYTDYEAQRNALLTGEIDAIDRVKVEDVESLQASGDFEIIERGRRFVDFILWNRANPLFADRDVRRALTMAIDRDGVNRVLLSTKARSYAEPAIGTVPPLLKDAYARDVKPLPYDQQAAAALLDASGWKVGADGVREKDGRRFRFTLLGNRETPRRMQTLRMVQQDLRKIGLDAEIEEISFSEAGTRITARDFDAAIYGFQSSLNLNQGDIWRSDAAFNFCGFSNAEVDRLIDEVRLEPDHDRLCTNLRRMQELVYDDQPVTFLCWFSRLVAVQKRFKNLGADALGFLTRVETCWVPLELQRRDKGR